MPDNVRESLKKAATRAFLLADHAGVHVMPAHYYSSVASRRDLRTSESIWRRRLDPIPFAWDLDAQADWVRETASSYAAEMPISRIMDQSEEVGGFRYGPIEGQLLYSVVRHHRPRTFLEIGSGSSTVILSRASQANVADGRAQTRIVAMDPFTADRVRHLPHVEAHSVGGDAADEAAHSLQTGDVLFIDSTHTVRTGSEVSHLYLEILPTIAPGVIVHIHDIYLPYLFAPNLYTSMFDWQETTLLAALLAGNPQFSVLACLSALHYDRTAQLQDVFPEYRPQPTEDGILTGAEGHFPSSFWMVKN